MDSLQELFIDFLSNMSKDTKVGFSADLFNLSGVLL